MFITGTFFTKEALLDFASTGCYCEYDLFGMEASHYQLHADIDMPSDAQRIERIKWLVDEGFEDNITIAHDVHTKHRLVSIGPFFVYCFSACNGRDHMYRSAGMILLPKLT